MPFYTTKVTLGIHDTTKKPGEALGLRRLTVEAEIEAGNLNQAEEAAIMEARVISGSSAQYIYRTLFEVK